jgi:hypothetical protein
MRWGGASTVVIGVLLAALVANGSAQQVWLLT